MTDDHDWVARLLAASGPTSMPEDVADRLARALRLEAERAVDGTAPGTPATGPAEAPTADEPRPAAPAGPAGPAAPAAPAAPVVAGTGAAGGGTAASTVDGTSSPGAAEAGDGAAVRSSPTGTDAAGPGQVDPRTREGDVVAGTGATGTLAAAAGAVPPAAVPPPATTGSLPRLRSVPGEGGTGDTTATGSTATGSRTRGSRRELREEDQGERRRRALARWAPVAAGVVILGGAAAVVGTQLGGQEVSMSAETAEDEAAAGAAAEAQPSVLVASGSQYTTADRAAFDTQVRGLVALAATDEAAAQSDAGTGTLSQEAAPASPDPAAGGAPSVAAPEGGAAAPAASEAPQLPAGARSAAEDSPLADPQRLAECIGDVTEGTSTTAAAVDLAVVDGVESTVIVVPDAAGLTYQVYVVGADCSAIDSSFQFFTVTP